MQQMMLYHAELVPTAGPSVVPIPNMAISKTCKLQAQASPRGLLAAIFAGLAEAKIFPPSSLHPTSITQLFLFIYKRV
jgi:hypothetical protein